MIQNLYEPRFKIMTIPIIEIDQDNNTISIAIQRFSKSPKFGKQLIEHGLRIKPSLNY